ncbi:MAG: exo-beta-N-acetylmuramidase NamZ domain-containing protein [Hyphomicrobiaceae bacterium]
MTTVTRRRLLQAGLAAASGMAFEGGCRALPAMADEQMLVTGAERLAADDFLALKGLKVGLITNQTGRVGDELLAHAMARSANVRLAAILSPEHGFSGTAEAGAKVTGGRDQATRVPVHSLYGKTLKPTPEMLEGLDALVFDMQDIGTRFYTYIATMGLAMQAAAQARLPFWVLDRPNPLGGTYVSGFVLERPFASFVGRYAIPIAHGLTVGELARLIKAYHLLPGLKTLALEFVPVEGWRRDMPWPDTGRPWRATSPNIPTFDTALVYPGMGLFEATTANEGRGTRAPFLQVGHPSIDGEAVARRIEKAALPGVTISPLQYRPQSIAGMATHPRHEKKLIVGVRIAVTEPSKVMPVELGIHCLHAFSREFAKRGKRGALIRDVKAFDRLAGTDRLRQMLIEERSPEFVAASWKEDVALFRKNMQTIIAYN